jgi:hypothetical protein
MSRAPLAVFAPLPPLRNGIADYVAELAPVLARDHDCVYVIDDAAPPWRASRISIISAIIPITPTCCRSRCGGRAWWRCMICRSIT